MQELFSGKEKERVSLFRGCLLRGIPVQLQPTSDRRDSMWKRTPLEATSWSQADEMSSLLTPYSGSGFS